VALGQPRIGLSAVVAGNCSCDTGWNSVNNTRSLQELNGRGRVIIRNIRGVIVATSSAELLAFSIWPRQVCPEG
jgi:hypothetical protein